MFTVTNHVPVDTGGRIDQGPLHLSVPIAQLFPRDVKCNGLLNRKFSTVAWSCHGSQVLPYEIRMLLSS